MKKTKIVLTVVLVASIGLVAGAVYIFNDIFPKAEPIKCPEIEDVVSVTLGCNTPDMSIPMGEKYYKDLLLCISEAKPTRKQAMDDYT